MFLMVCKDRWKVYNWLVFTRAVKTAIAVECLCVSTSKKTALLPGFFISYCLFLFACAAINRVNLAFRTTKIEDAHLTLAVIPFKLEANNFLNFLPLQKYEKKFAEFPFLLVYNSLVDRWLWMEVVSLMVGQLND